MKQTITSKLTANNQIPMIHKHVDFSKFDSILDFGSGRGRGADYLKSKGSAVFKYDPYWETEEDNDTSLLVFSLGDTVLNKAVICANVLNVLTDDILPEVMSELVRYARTGCTVYINVYEKTGTGIPVLTKNGTCYQRCEKTKTYADKFRCFAGINVETMHGGKIIVLKRD